MPRLLLRSAKDPFLALTPEAAMAKNVVGTNSGNLLFGEAVHKTLSVPGTEVVANAYLTERGVSDRHVERINDEFDAFVVPLANAFRRDFEQPLARLTDVIEKLRIPVVVVGVGAQVSPTSLELPPAVRATTRRFLRAVLDRSATVGVRGEITAQCLAALGFGAEHVQVIGCPSLFFGGPELEVHKRVESLTPQSPVAVNLTPSRTRMAEILNLNLARYERLVYVPQERKELGLMLWGEEPPEHADPRLPLHRSHPALTSGRTAYFCDPTPWRSFMREQHFAFGTRIHGNIAALQAGTPAHVLTFDSRTLELARYHEIPHTPLEDVGDDLDAADLYERTDCTAFNKGHRARTEVYLQFLEDNGLDHVFGPDGRPDDFDARLAEISFPPAVTPLVEGSDTFTDQLLDRLTWLRQGHAVDADRTHATFTPSFAPGRPSVSLGQLDQRLQALRTEVQELSGQVSTLTDQEAERRASADLSAVARARRLLSGGRQVVRRAMSLRQHR